MSRMTKAGMSSIRISVSWFAGVKIGPKVMPCRRASPPDPPYTIARGDPAPRSAPVAHSRSLARFSSPCERGKPGDRVGRFGPGDRAGQLERLAFERRHDAGGHRTRHGRVTQMIGRDVGETGARIAP